VPYLSQYIVNHTKLFQLFVKKGLWNHLQEYSQRTEQPVAHIVSKALADLCAFPRKIPCKKSLCTWEKCVHKSCSSGLSLLHYLCPILLV
jgi:hypothetical protein